jgi:drug/metabolite transporter (DMT)-like permease
LVQDKVRGRLALPAVAVGVLAVSAAAIFIQLADAPTIAVAFWRCALGAALLLPPALVRRERFPRGRDLHRGWPRAWRWVFTSGSGYPRSTIRAWRRA